MDYSVTYFVNGVKHPDEVIIIADSLLHAVAKAHNNLGEECITIDSTPNCVSVIFTRAVTGFSVTEQRQGSPAVGRRRQYTPDAF